MGEEIKDAKLMISFDDGKTLQPLEIKDVEITCSHPEIKETEGIIRRLMTSADITFTAEAKVNKTLLRIITGSASNNARKRYHYPKRRHIANLVKFHKRIQKAINKHMKIPYYKFPWWADVNINRRSK